MEQHMKILGILNIVYASFGILVALVIFAIFGGSAGLVAANNDPDAAVAIPILGFIGVFIIFCVAIFTAPAFIAGIGLLKFKKWSRPWAIVASVVYLLCM